MKDQHEKYMSMAMELAVKGFPHVNPNPMVGCVIVKDGKIEGRGYHTKYGKPHAEVEAVLDAGETAVAGSDVYVTLEPCTYYGQTPPCVDLLIKLKPSRVFIANQDPNPLVAGKGLAKLREAGIEVMDTVLADKGELINRRFFTLMRENRPYIILKWAQTADGFIAREDGSSKWISSDASRKLVHQWRSEEAGIMVGKNTAIIDNPTLNVRDYEGDDPVRIVIDKNLEIPSDYNIYQQNQSTLIYNSQSDEALECIQRVKLDFEEAVLPQILADLAKRKIISVLVEGGSYLLNRLIQAGYWDEARIFKSKTEFGSGKKAPDSNYMKVIRELVIGEDQLLFCRPN